MPFNFNGTPTTINYVYTVESGTWTATTSGIGYPWDGVITAGTPCQEPNPTVKYQDNNGNWFVCLGTVLTEIRTLKKDTTYIYVKTYVSFDSNLGSSVSSKYVYYQSTYGTLTSPTRTGYTFDGWYTDETWATEVTSATTVTTTSISQTLYAKWIQDAVPIPTTRLGAWQGATSGFDQSFHLYSLSSAIGSTYNGRTARIVLFYKNGTAGTQSYLGDMQIDRIRYGGQTFDMDTDEVWQRGIAATSTTAQSYNTAFASPTTLGTSATNDYFSRDLDKTGSSNTGRALPSEGTAHYAIYPETSSGGFGFIYYARSPEFTFSYNTTRDILIAADGDNCGTMAVYIVDSEASDFTPSFTGATEMFPSIELYWAFLQETSSEPVYDVICQTDASGWAGAKTALDYYYPVENQTEGDIGVAFNFSTGIYYVFEAVAM